MNGPSPTVGEFLDRPTQKMLIGSEAVEAADGSTIAATSPSDGATLGAVPKAGRPDVDQAVEAVTKALNEIEGIEEVQVDLSKGEATFEEVQPVDMNIVKEGVKRAGYEVV